MHAVDAALHKHGLTLSYQGNSTLANKKQRLVEYLTNPEKCKHYQSQQKRPCHAEPSNTPGATTVETEKGKEKMDDSDTSDDDEFSEDNEPSEESKGEDGDLAHGDEW